MINKAPLGSFRTLSNLNDPIAQIIFKTRAGNLYAVEFVSESGLREQLGRKE